MTWEKYPGGRTNIQEFFRGKKSLLLKILFHAVAFKSAPAEPVHTLPKTYA